MGDNNVYVRILINSTDKTEELRFTNLTMDTVKQAIDLLNGDPVPAPRNGLNIADFARDELFPYRFESGESCAECGAWVPGDSQNVHVTWHNKLLP